MSESRTASRRVVLTSGAAIAAGLGLLGTALSDRAGGETRSVRTEAEGGSPDGCRGVSVGVYQDPSVEDAAIPQFVFRKYRYVLGQLEVADAIDGWRLRRYETSLEATEAGNSVDGSFGCYDVQHMLEAAGWDRDEDLQVWLTSKAHEKVVDPYTGGWQHNDVHGGGAHWSSAFEPGPSTCWKSTRTRKRVATHGAAMELLHCLIDGSLPAVERLHGGHGEHALGDLIHEYNDDYGAVGWYGSPIAAGPDTWDQGVCRRPTDPTPERDGFTFTVADCAMRAVALTAAEYC